MVSWGRRNRLLLVVWVVIVAVAVPVALLNRDTSANAEALVMARALDMNMESLPDYAEAVFTNGEVARAVAESHGGQPAEVVPDRVSLATEPDSVVLRVIGHDPDPETAAAIADVAAGAFVQELNMAGAGVGEFAVQAEADPGVPAQPDGEEADADLTWIAVSLAVGLAVGLAAGFAFGRLSASGREERGLGAGQEPLF
jgi:capsular polysaccharide biosynthesis protein